MTAASVWYGFVGETNKIAHDFAVFIVTPPDLLATRGGGFTGRSLATGVSLVVDEFVAKIQGRSIR